MIKSALKSAFFIYSKKYYKNTYKCVKINNGGYYE